MSRKGKKPINPGEGDTEMAVSAGKMKSIDFGKLTFAKEPLSTAKSVKDVVPFQWPKEVYAGDSKVTVAHLKK